MKILNLINIGCNSGNGNASLPRGLDHCPFQQKDESAIFAVPSLYRKGLPLD